MDKVLYFERAIDLIVKMHEKKAHDYTDAHEFGNFIESAHSAGIEPYQAIENLIGTKEARIRTIRRRQTEDVANEPLIDSYLDRAVYAIIAYAYMLSLNNTAKASQGDGLYDRNR